MGKEQDDENAKKEALLEKLNSRYVEDGLKLNQQLEGLTYHSGVHYWDYIAVETLLSLQRPITNFHDELIFITYHQISELYFKLSIHELLRLTSDQGSNAYMGVPYDEYVKNSANWIKAFKRIDSYFETLVDSIKLMGYSLLDNDQFSKFRLSLLPASGFQTAAFREIELLMTGLENLQYGETTTVYESFDEQFNNLYWKTGGIQTILKGEKYEKVMHNKNGVETPAKTKTLSDFEDKYDQRFRELATKFRNNNIYSLFLGSSDEIKSNQSLKRWMSKVDERINVGWKGNHHGIVSSQLDNPKNRTGNDPQGTGGTNWKDFLPPKNQRIKYFPSISEWEFRVSDSPKIPETTTE